MSVLPVGIAASGDEGYTIDNSLRFRSAVSAYLSRTFSTPTNNKIWTLSLWVKKGILTTDSYLVVANTASAFEFIKLNNSAADNFEYAYWNGSSYSYQIRSTLVLRDPSAWYHVVMSVDTTQATAANRVKVYINNEQITSFSITSYPAQNTNTKFNSAVAARIGSAFGSNYFDGYLTEINFVDGQALTADDFGETDATTGVWKPKAYSGTYGTNGFYLENGRGTDQSGNSNNWTENNFNTSTSSATTYDVMTDVPTLTDENTANYCTLNPLWIGSGITTSNANLTATASTSANSLALGTIAVSSGKWYWESTVVSGTSMWASGIASTSIATPNYSSLSAGNSYAWNNSSTSYNGQTGTTYGATYTTGDVIGVALDLDAGTITFYKNNTSQGVAYTGISGTFTPMVLLNTSAININFGQRPFAYTPPTGFKKLNTYNLPDSTIEDGSKYFDTLTYTGTGSLTTRTGLDLASPVDLVWIKSRSAATNHVLEDSVRGTGYVFDEGTNSTDFEGPTGGGWIQNFSTSGFSTDVNTPINTNGATYVSWNWVANGSGVSNTVGDIPSTVSANTTSGFSIVSFNAGAAGNHTVGHGLGVSPNLIIMKDRDSTGYGNWLVFHSDVCTSTSNYLLLNGTGALGSVANSWGSALPTSTVFGYGSNVNVGANDNIIAYCFASTEGFSKFGSYTGNGSADGPFIYTGFRPAWLLVKRSDAAYFWYIHDAKRNTYNVLNKELYPNSSSAEVTATRLDFTSNGFKVRGTQVSQNASGGTYIYAAFAENPFKNALAR